MIARVRGPIWVNTTHLVQVDRRSIVVRYTLKTHRFD
jgi:hypothetical protein